ncbi:beta strand repeat-containing protein [Streptomyces mirabilis]|uniref:beta strand repeat-containing protein n=1 Tax=Streptomyces mirabilis TaxID=68239 RepID=UPI0036BEFDD8
MVNVIVSSAGTQGPRGNTVLSGHGTPGAGTGVDGDYYVDTTNYPTSAVLYGPKAAGAWPGSGVTLGGGGGGGAVTSVNGQTGAVTITAAGLGALLAANNLSDLANAGTARTNLGLGNSATRNIGTTAGTAAAGDDSRIAGAAQKAQNLADLADPAAARSNLGLGSAATQNSSAFDAAGAAASAQAAAIAAIPGAAATVTSETAYGQAAAAGSATAYSHGDHTHGTPALTSTAPGTTQGVGTAAAVGTASTPARADHAHPMAAAGAPQASAVGDTGATGTASTFAASDHVHARESFGTVTAQTTFGASSANGTAVTPSRSDHTHGTPSLPAASGGTQGVVQLAGDLAGTAASPQVVGTHLASPLPVAQGGTGASTASAALAALSGTPISAVRSITSTAVTANAWDVLECDATSNAITVTLPANVAGTVVTVKKMDATVNAVTITGTVDGTVNPTLAFQYGSMELVADGTKWLRVVRPALGALVDYPATTDSRYIQQGAAAGGDLSGTLPSPTVAKVNGVAVSGTPATGYVPTATGTTAATWQALPVATTGAQGIVQLAGDLGGTGASPSVLAVHGVTVPGSPVVGAVLTATGSATAAWQSPVAAEISGPQANGLLSWNGSVLDASGSNSLASGTVLLQKIMVPYTITFTNLLYYVGTGGSALTAGQSLVGLYSSAGTLLSGSADQSSSWTSVGAKTIALTTPQTITGGAGVFVWAGILSVGTTMPVVAAFTVNSTVNLSNIGTTNANSRFASTGSSLTALPASFTPSALTQSARSLWTGVS